jgi:hypothetical protein
VQASKYFMRYVEFGCGVGGNKNMGMWAGKNKWFSPWWVGWFHPVE